MQIIAKKKKMCYNYRTEDAKGVIMQQFTKKEIKLTMLKLLQTKPLDSIKVRNIIDECGISRNTFYYHYHDIYDVLADTFDNILDEIIKNDSDDFSWESAFHQMAGSALINKNIISNIFSSKYADRITLYVANGIGRIIESKVKALCKKKGISVNDDDIRIISTFYKHAITGTFTEWVQLGMKTNPEDFIKKLGKIFPENIENSINIIEND